MTRRLALKGTYGPHSESFSSRTIARYLAQLIEKGGHSSAYLQDEYFEPGILSGQKIMEFFQCSPSDLENALQILRLKGIDCSFSQLSDPISFYAHPR